VAKNNRGLNIMDFLPILLIVSVVIIAALLYMYASLKAQIPVRVQEQCQSWQREADSELQKQVKVRFQEWCDKEAQSIKAISQKEAITQAQALFQTWCEREVESIRKAQRDVADGEANNKLNEWKIEQTKSISKDAIQRSQSVILGNITQHIIPYLPEFVYNPKDARFIGSPVDFIIFDGLGDENGEVKEVVFVEVKTNKSSLSPRERQIRRAIESRRVRWVELRVNREIKSGVPGLFQ
jgi:predicted Holliday junction resolvase-like endonuclease